MTQYIQKKDSHLQIVYLALSDRREKEQTALQISAALLLHGITPLHAPELSRDVGMDCKKFLDGEPELNSITHYSTHTRYASVNLGARHTQTIIELPRKGQDLVVCINSWLDMPQEELRTYLQRGIIDKLRRDGIKERETKPKDMPQRYLDQAQAFSISTSLRNYA